LRSKEGVFGAISGEVGVPFCWMSMLLDVDAFAVSAWSMPGTEPVVGSEGRVDCSV
jgi:hypothetical protein